MKKLSRLVLLALFLCCLFVIVACSESGENTSGNAEPESVSDPENNNNGTNNDTSTNNNDVNDATEPDPITITFMIDYPEDRLNRKFIEPIQDAFPHITIEQINVQSVNREQVEEMVTRGEFPDLAFFHNSAGIELFEEFELAYDLSELIAQHNYDLNRFQERSLEKMHRYREGKVYGLPIWDTGWVTYYNKDIFDMFGVSYPEDGITWDEAIDLARQLTGEEGGIQYRGLDIGGEAWPHTQWGVGHTDPETDEPLYLTDPSYRTTFEMLDRVFSIPGNYPDDPVEHFNQFWMPFVNEQNIAMVASNEDARNLHAAYLDGFENWDMVTWPQFEELPGVGSHAAGSMIGMSSMTEHPDEVFQILALLTSEEYQTTLSETGLPTPLNSTDVQSAYAADLGLDDKNFDAIFQLEFAEVPADRRPDAEFDMPGLGDVLENGLHRLANQDADIQTILREMEEEANARIADARGSS